VIALVIVLQVAGAAPGAQQAAPLPLEDPRAVQLGVRVQPETVTVGDRFTVLLRVRAPAGSTIEFPARPDSGAVEMIGRPAVTEPRSDTLWVEQTAGYRMAAWDIGGQPIPFPNVVVRLAGSERQLPVGARAVFVQSVLPADTTLHVPKPARAAFAFVFPQWLWWLLALVILLLLALLAWWLWRRLRPGARALPPFETAEREFTRIEAMGLPGCGEGPRHVALMTDVLRDYLAARLSRISGSQTTRELLRAAAGSPEARWEPSLHARAERLLSRADLAKFAALSVPEDDARALGAEARALAAETERRVTAPEEKVAA
jgi:hypothetical protein